MQEFQSFKDIGDDLLAKLDRARAARSSQPNPSGIGPSVNLQAYECDVCQDSGGSFAWQKHDPFPPCEVFVPCPVCTPRKQIAALLKSSEITEEFLAKTFENFRLDVDPAVRAAYRAAQHYAEHFENIRQQKVNSMALLGLTGAGKTHLLMAICNKIMRFGRSVLYFPWVSGSKEFRNFDEKAKNLKRMEQMQQVDLLFIDDLFKGRSAPTDFQMEVLFDVLNYRYLEKKPFLISSEWNIQRIGDYEAGGDPAIAGRIYERTGGTEGYLLNIKGDPAHINYRLRVAE